MNSLKVKILTDHQEIHITFAFQITGAVRGRRVGAQPLQLLMMFSFITVFTIKKKKTHGADLSVPGTHTFKESSPVPGRIVLYVLNHERSQERALPFSVELGLSWLNHCVPEI